MPIKPDSAVGPEAEEEKARRFLKRAEEGREPDGPLPEDETPDEEAIEDYAAERASNAAIGHKPSG